MFGYEETMRAADALEKAGGSAGVAGISVRGRDIKYIKAGDGEKGGIIVTGGIHAREHVTAKLVVMQRSTPSKTRGFYKCPSILFRSSTPTEPR